jgi:hypothetical protein
MRDVKIMDANTKILLINAVPVELVDMSREVLRTAGEQEGINPLGVGKP